MRYTYLIIVLLVSVTLVNGQTPQKMSYQAVVRNANNILVTNSTIGIRISIIQGSATGNAVYIENQKPITNSNGLASIEIGTGTVESGVFSTINWANGPYYVKSEIDINGLSNYTILGTSQLLTVPYAFYAKTAENVINGSGGLYNHYIGENFGGGIVFHLWKDASGIEHGLIVALTDQSKAQNWSNITSIMIGTTAQSTFNGLSNSNAIISQAGHSTSATSLVKTYRGGGFSDWYLPAIDELNIIYLNRFNINKTLYTISGATTINQNFYWSSTEDTAQSAWCKSFSNGDTYFLDKITQIYIRAIRSF